MLKAHTLDNGRAVGERLWPRADVDVPLPWRTRWAVYELAVDDVRDARDGGPATFDGFDRGDEQRALREAHWQLVLGAALYKRTAIWLECVPAAEERAAAAGVRLRIPPLALCTDNGAMIAALGAQLIAAGHPPSALDVSADSTLPVTHIQA